MASMETIPPYHVIVVAAGSGTRLSTNTPKQYIEIGGKTILRHTLENILAWPSLNSAQVVINPDHRELYKKATDGLSLKPYAMGGATRKDSVYNALKSRSDIEDDDMILIHDAARPFVAWHDVRTLLHSLLKTRAATLATPCQDTLRRAADNYVAHEIVDRDKLYQLQTPQGFRFCDLRKAHEQQSRDVTDDTALVTALGIDVKLVTGSRNNFKITTTDDLAMAQTLLEQYETRTGMGFDVHAFSIQKEKPLIISGIKIDFDKSLEGHSDADVALHAITDAVLGAIGAGDIGQHFPPSDPQFKDQDSAIFLKAAHDMVLQKHGTIQNIDLTIICEAPKIGPYREAMRTRIAEILDIAESRINIKATTTEKLGFTGRKEGIAAQAVASVKLPCA